MTVDHFPRWYFPEPEPVGTGLASPEAARRSTATRERTRARDAELWIG